MPAADDTAAARQDVGPRPVVRCVARRVDAFTYAAQVEIDASTWERVEAAKAEAEALRHPVPVELGALAGRPDSDPQTGEVRARLDFSLSHLGRGVHSLQNADAQILLSREGAGGWTFEVRILAACLARRTFRDAIATARGLAQALGRLDLATPGKERCRRLDLAADFAHWEIAAEDNRGLLKRQRATVTDFWAADDAGVWERPEAQTYRQGDRPTGIVVAPGGRLMARIYDKRAELRLRNVADKTELEEALWRSGGWDGAAPVARVEMQLRTEALREMRIVVPERSAGDDHRPRWVERTLCDDLESLASMLDAVWAYCCARWLTLRVPDGDRRLDRCALDPRWEAVQRVTWDQRQPPAVRRRRRGGATAAQSLGCLFSTLASVGLLPFNAANDATYPQDPANKDALQDWSDAHLESWLRCTLLAVTDAFVGYACRELPAAHDSLRELVWSLVVKRRATAARFALLPDAEAGDARNDTS